MHSLSRDAETCSGSAEAVGVNPALLSTRDIREMLERKK